MLLVGGSLLGKQSVKKAKRKHLQLLDGPAFSIYHFICGGPPQNQHHQHTLTYTEVYLVTHFLPPYSTDEVVQALQGQCIGGSALGFST